MVLAVNESVVKIRRKDIQQNEVKTHGLENSGFETQWQVVWSVTGELGQGRDPGELPIILGWAGMGASWTSLALEGAFRLIVHDAAGDFKSVGRQAGQSIGRRACLVPESPWGEA